MPTKPVGRRRGRAQEEVHRRYLSGALRRVHLAGPLSRSDLAGQMGLNRSTVMGLTTELVGVGLVAESLPSGEGLPGRPSWVLHPVADRAHVLAFDVAVDRLVAARVAFGGTIQDRREAPRRRAVVDLDYVVEVLSEFGGELQRDATPGSVCVGVGASYCGMIRRGDGVVRFGPDLGWVDQAFGAEMERRLGLGMRVKVGNEAHLGARAEHQRGAGVGFRNLIYLHGDVGVGGGIIVGNRLLDGDSGYACELGHMVVNPHDGRPCGCGSAGCLEAEVGERALLDAAHRSDRAGRDAIREVVQAAAAGDERARQGLDEIGDWLGIGVVNLINLFNPGVVIFGGMLQEIYPASETQVRARIDRNVLPISRERARLSLAGLGDDATLVGAAELAFSDLLADPTQVLDRSTTYGSL